MNLYDGPHATKPTTCYVGPCPKDRPAPAETQRAYEKLISEWIGNGKRLTSR